MTPCRSLRFALTVGFAISPLALHADIVSVSTGAALSFASSAGSVVLLNPSNGSVFATTGFSGFFNSDSKTGAGPISVSVISEDLPDIFPGSAAASADASQLTAANGAEAQIGEFLVPASSTGRSTIAGTLEIQNATGPVTLNPTAGIQLFETSETGSPFQSIRGEEIVSLTLSNGDRPISFDNVLTSEVHDETDNFNVTGASQLQANTPYDFTFLVESDAQANVEPEPSFLLLSILLFAGLFAAHRFRARRLSTGPASSPSSAIRSKKPKPVHGVMLPVARP